MAVTAAENLTLCVTGLWVVCAILECLMRCSRYQIWVMKTPRLCSWSSPTKQISGGMCFIQKEQKWANDGFAGEVLCGSVPTAEHWKSTGSCSFWVTCLSLALLLKLPWFCRQRYLQKTFTFIKIHRKAAAYLHQAWCLSWPVWSSLFCVKPFYIMLGKGLSAYFWSEVNKYRKKAILE